MTEGPRRLAVAVAALALASAVAGCGRDPSATAADRAAHAQAARQPAELEADGVRIRASLVPTAALSAEIAQRYGVPRERGLQLLLVGVRTGPAADETSLPAGVAATVRDLRGVRQDVLLREVRSEGFLDYAGAVRVRPPDTLAFEVQVVRAGAAPATLRFSRDLFP